MKFTCSQQLLSKALNTVSKAVTTRSTLPILKGILLKATGGDGLILSASDLDISIEKKITDALIEEGGSVVVSAKLFTDIIRKLPDEDVSVEQLEDGNVFIKTSMSEFTIVGQSADEFPEIGEIDEDERITFNKETFKEMIRKTSFSASIDEGKGIIVGVLIEFDENYTNMIGIDGFRMAVLREQIQNENKNRIIINSKILGDVNKILSDIEDEEELTIILSKKKAILICENVKIVIRLLEGEFIKYKDILPKEKNCSVRIRRSIFHEGMERASILSKEGKNNLIKFAFTEGLLTITSRSEEGNVREEIVVEKEGDDIEIGFNSKYILDVLKVLDDDEIVMEMVSSVKPCVIKPVSGNRFEYLVLPVRIS